MKPGGMIIHWAGAACAVVVLAGCPTVDLGDTPPDIGLCNPKGGLPYFTDTLWPMYLTVSGAKNCTQNGGACHDNAHGLALDTAAPIDFETNYRIAQSYVNCGSPMASLMLTKPMAGIEGHGGGDIFPMGDPQADVFLGWFK